MKLFRMLVACVGGLLGDDAYAVDKCTSRVSTVYASMPAPPIKVTTGPDAPVMGTPLSEWSPNLKFDIYDCESTSSASDDYLILADPSNGSIGSRYVDGTKYQIFSTSLAGIGVIVRFQPADHSMTLGLGDGVATIHDPYYGTVVSLYVSARLVATGAPLSGGTLNVPAQQMATFRVKKTGTALIGNPSPIYLWLNGTQVNVTANTCLAALPSQGVDLVKRAAAVFDHKGKLEKAREFEIALNCSGSGGPFDLYATFTDVQSPSNLGTDITLAPGSAKGLGLQLWKDGEALRMGPDSRSPANPNRWYVGKVNGTVNIPLEAWYVQTGDAVEPGPVNAAVTFTLSYP